MDTSILVSWLFDSSPGMVILLLLVIWYVSVAVKKYFTSSHETVRELQRPIVAHKKDMPKTSGKAIYKNLDISLEFKPHAYCILHGFITLVNSDFTPEGGRLQLNFHQALTLLEELDKRLELPANHHPATYEEAVTTHLAQNVKTTECKKEEVATVIVAEVKKEDKIDPKFSEPMLI